MREPSTQKNIFLEKTYLEAFELLAETHAYIKTYSLKDMKKINKLESFCFSREVTRLTARMVQIIGWLNLQKVLGQDKYKTKKIGRSPFEENTMCLDSLGAQDVCLPPHLKRLLEASLRLYMRVVRLDRMMRQPLLQNKRRSLTQVPQGQEKERAQILFISTQTPGNDCGT